MLIAYAKGARIFERHIDINTDGVKVSPYNSLPHQIDHWFKAFKKAKEMCGGSGVERRFIPEKETTYLDALVRGAYARRDLPEGYVLSHANMHKDFYLAIPLLKGQLSCREIMNGEVLSAPLKRDDPLTIHQINSPFTTNSQIRAQIEQRGL